MFKSIPQEFNELSYDVLYEVLYNLHSKVTKVFSNVFDDYVIYKLKEMKYYLHELTKEFKYGNDSNSNWLYDLKMELVRVESELLYLESIAS